MSNRLSPDDAARAGRCPAVCYQSEFTSGDNAKAVIGFDPVSGRSRRDAGRKLGVDRIGKLLEGGEMEIRPGHGLRFGRAAEAFLALAALDPAGGIAKLPSDADVVILALGDMQYLRLPVAEQGLPSLVEGEELRVGLGAAGFVAGHAVMEWTAERMRIGGNAVRSALTGVVLSPDSVRNHKK